MYRPLFWGSIHLDTFRYIRIEMYRDVSACLFDEACFKPMCLSAELMAWTSSVCQPTAVSSARS